MATVNRRSFLCALGFGVAPIMVGCGGSVPRVPGMDSTRAKVLAMHERVTGSARAFGAAAPSSGMMDGGVGNSGGSTGGGGVPGSGGAAVGMPYLGAFLNQKRPGAGGSSRKRVSARATRQEDGGSSTWYFDWFLGLWVEVLEEPGRSRYSLYVDEEKTQSAGHMETIWPVDWETYPMQWSSTYEFTEGVMQGTSGTWSTVSETMSSGSSSGEHRWSDGALQTSESKWTQNGDSTWRSRSEGPGKWWSESAGTFRSDGSGGMRHEDSDGYSVVYVYNRDGSGRATFSGPEKDLPVVIEWDGRGNAWMIYADGRREKLENWWGHWWGGGVVTGGGSDGGSGTGEG